MVKGLERSLDNEKLNSNKLMRSINEIKATNEIERIAASDRIKILEKELKRMRRSQYIPGLIGGARIDSDHNIEPTVGIGWKINLF